MCFACDLLCDAVWRVFVFAVIVCDVLKPVWFGRDLLCDGVWSVVCLGLCLCACWFGLLVWLHVKRVLVCLVCGVCLYAFSVFACFWCAMYCVMLYVLCFAHFVRVNVLFIYLHDVFMMNGVMLSGFVVLLCVCAFGV